MDKTLLIIPILAVVVLVIFFVGLYLPQKTAKAFLISDYSCEQVKDAIEGRSLVRYSNIFFTYRYEAEELYFYYQINCQGS